MTDEEKRGVAAIIFLQSMAGITESEEKALKIWRGFKQWEKDRTMVFFDALSPESEE